MHLVQRTHGTSHIVYRTSSLTSTSYVVHRPTCFPGFYSTSFQFLLCAAFGFRAFCDGRLIRADHDLILRGMLLFSDIAGVENLILLICRPYRPAILISVDSLQP